MLEKEDNTVPNFSILGRTSSRFVSDMIVDLYQKHKLSVLRRTSNQMIHLTKRHKRDI